MEWVMMRKKKSIEDELTGKELLENLVFQP